MAEGRDEESGQRHGMGGEAPIHQPLGPRIGFAAAGAVLGVVAAVWLAVVGAHPLLVLVVAAVAVAAGVDAWRLTRRRSRGDAAGKRPR